MDSQALCGDISVVMPSYNEKENISEAIRRIEDCLSGGLREIIVVDDNSPDETWKLVEELKNPKCRVIRRMNERGLASALADGTKAAAGNIVVWLDCDLGIPPENIRSLVDHLDRFDVVIGSRYVGGGGDTRPVFRAFLSTAFNIYAGLFLGFKVRDYTSGFAACRRSVLEKIPLSRQGFGDYFIEWAFDCVRADVRLKEVAYVYGLRKAGVSKTDGDWNTFFRLSRQYAMRVLETRFKKR